ncbi:XRE family transcriptional regulator [Paenibacillus sp. 1011MAR3C5]|uniref:helix-turn-helix domain-containing protein n=1 Tax=Paenibacillus sp. 1011MAR3C5 TaxID=1675787 RepID=UPI000E6C40A6|nr:helix-turn-helix transcriptional regulator [Paenibacillus sp. 1011MAR3C5]RJE89906.1 XRE family transcriptional regulator [Paenibacillus sp. 1011MAR3C5]
MSVHQQLFHLLNQPMIILKEHDGIIQVDDANEAFMTLTGFPLSHLLATKSQFLKSHYRIDLRKRILKREIMMPTKRLNQLAVRIEQIPLPCQPDDPWIRAFLIFEDLTAFKWIDRQLEKGKVLISGVVDKHLHIRFLRDNMAPLLFEPDTTMEDETLLQFIAETERPRMMEIFQEPSRLLKEQNVTIHTSKLSGIELELELTYCPVLNGHGHCSELAFVVWDLRPANDQVVDSATKLKIWMAKRDMSAGQLAASTGISLQTISKLRNGKIEKPQRLTAELIASELGVDVHHIWPSIRK